MKHQYRFPIKGSYYYSADQAFQQGLLFVGQRLQFKAEPDNEHDPHALQIWMNPQAEDGYLLGYLPRQLALYWQPLLKDTLRDSPDDIRLTLHRSIAKGRLLRLECLCELDPNWLQHLHFQLVCFWIRQTHRLKFWRSLRPMRQIRDSRPD